MLSCLELCKCAPTRSLSQVTMRMNLQYGAKQVDILLASLDSPPTAPGKNACHRHCKTPATLKVARPDFTFHFCLFPYGYTGQPRITASLPLWGLIWLHTRRHLEFITCQLERRRYLAVKWTEYYYTPLACPTRTLLAGRPSPHILNWWPGRHGSFFKGTDEKKRDICKISMRILPSVDACYCSGPREKLRKCCHPSSRLDVGNSSANTALC